MIGRLPYLYFLLLKKWHQSDIADWKTAVLLLPSTPRRCRSSDGRLEDCRITTSFYFRNPDGTVVVIGRLPYYYFLLLSSNDEQGQNDWKTAVLLLPSTQEALDTLLLRLEDCRITTSFYSRNVENKPKQIGRLPYYYFLLL